MVANRNVHILSNRSTSGIAILPASPRRIIKNNQPKRKSNRIMKTRKTRTAWPKTEVDWSKSNKELSKKLNISYETVCQYRRKQAPTTCKSLITWAAVNWSKSNKQLASELKVSYTTVTKKRTELAPDTKRKLSFDGVDWSKSTKVIAIEKGCLITQVSRARKAIAPETRYTHRLTSAQRKTNKTNLAGLDWSLSDTELAIQTGCNPKDMKKNRPKYAPNTVGIVHEYPDTKEPVLIGDYISVNDCGKEIITEVVSIHNEPWVRLPYLSKVKVSYLRDFKKAI